MAEITSKSKKAEIWQEYQKLLKAYQHLQDEHGEVLEDDSHIAGAAVDYVQAREAGPMYRHRVEEDRAYVRLRDLVLAD